MSREFTQIDLISELLLWLDGHGCKTLNHRAMNAVIAAADSIIAEIDKPDVLASSGMGLAAWLRSDATGLSSKYMAWKLAPAAGLIYYTDLSERDCRDAYPHDPADFHRCIGLLEAVPELRPHIHLLAGEGHPPEWQRMAAEWDALETLYREELPMGKCPKLYARLCELRRLSLPE